MLLKMSEKQKRQILDLIAGPLAVEGCEIADLALSRYRTSVTLRVFVYSEGGATVDECARISRISGDILDGPDLFTSGYLLEVSTPGLDRPLATALDFKYRVGETVKIEKVDKSADLVAEILSATETEVRFRDEDGGDFALPLAEIAKAKIVY